MNPIVLQTGVFCANCYIYLFDTQTEDGTAPSLAVIDPGGDAERIIAALRETRREPEYILLTHGHFDHIGAAARLYDAYGRKPRIAIAQADSRYLGERSWEAHLACLNALGLSVPEDMNFSAAPPPGLVLTDGAAAGPFTCLLVPGHSEGSAVFYDEKAKVLFSGDTLFQSGCGRTDLPGGDSRKLRNSLARLLSMDEDIRVFPGHGGETTIAAERAFWNFRHP